MNLLSYTRNNFEGERKIFQLKARTNSDINNEVIFKIDDMSIKTLVIKNITNEHSIVEFNIDDFILNFGDDNDLDEIIEIISMIENDVQSTNRVMV